VPEPGVLEIDARLPAGEEGARRDADGDNEQDRDEDVRARDRDSPDRDPRDVFLEALELPRGREREVVVDGDNRYELNGEPTANVLNVLIERLQKEDKDFGGWRAEN